MSDKTFEQQVQEAVGQASRTNEGKLTFPKELKDEIKYAATLEIRRRDTQKSFVKAQQAQQALKKEKDTLLDKLSNSVKVDIPESEKEKYDELLVSDPQAWRAKINALEAKAANEQKQEIEKELKTLSEQEIAEEEINRRKTVLSEFIKQNPGFVINDDIIQNDIPPRISKKLETNEISFEDFLSEAADYLNSGKIISDNQKVMNQPNLNKADGNETPSEEVRLKASETSYLSEIY